MTTTTTATLYYVYDPMCSWCWGFKPTWDLIQESLADEITIEWVLGGLAPDTDQPMPDAMQQQIASYWQKIEHLLGTQFNYDFWSQNTPRRATYPACRAILAARVQGAEVAMNNAIQKGYYLEAKNPSDNDRLLEFAHDIGLDMTRFERDLVAAETQSQLLNELQFARSIGGNSFPSLFVAKQGRITELPIDYKNAAATIQRVRELY
ncbi:DsbA family protein [Vibrio sp. E150_011]